MRTYKVIKSFGIAKKGDIFELNEDGMYSMDRTDEHKNGASISKVQMEMSQDVIDEFVEKGLMIEIKEETSDIYEQKVNDIADYVDELINTYENSYKDMI